MKNELLQELQNVEYEILKEVAAFCDRNDIQYFLIGGTLLGAVRHGGFIPWDDDIDIGMDLKNYKKFLKLSMKSFPDGYFVQHYRTEKKFNYPWIKIKKNNTTFMDKRMTDFDVHSGVFIDIFLYNGISENKLRRKFQLIAARTQRILLRKYYFLEGDVVNTHSNIIYHIMPDFIRRFLIRVLDNIVNIDCEKTKWCYDTYFVNIGRECKYKSEWFKDLEKVKFGDDYFQAPNSMEEWLVARYGDWKTLPPEEERIGHGDLIIDLEKDYTEYFGEEL